MPKPIPRDTIGLADRLAIQDCLLFYGYSMDRGHAEGVASCFTEDGLVTNAAGERFTGRDGIYRFAANAMKNPLFRGRQHHIRPMFFQASGDGYRVTSYYQALSAPVGKPVQMGSMGAYVDEVVRNGVSWKIKSKVLHHIRSDRPAPPLGDQPLLRTVPGGLQGPDTPTSDERAAMEALMMTYATALDTADVAAMTAAFAPGAVFESGSVGKVTAPAGIRTFLAAASGRPGFGGRQHRIFPLLYRREGKGWRTFSYWKVETWTVGSPATVVNMGYYDDLLERREGEWRFAQKAIHPWNSQVAPMYEGWVQT